MTFYLADFTADCRRCGTSPCVIARDHDSHGTKLHDTDLCGVCFFQDRSMVDPEFWNDQREATE